MPLSDPEKPKQDSVMDVTEEQIARVYARAFLGVVAKATNTGDLVDEMGAVVTDLLEPHPRLEEVLGSELISHEDKQGILDRVLGGHASAEVLSFLKVLAIRRRLGLVRSIVRMLAKLYAEHRGMAEIEIRVAQPLDSGLQQEIHNHLRDMLGTEPVLNVTVDPSLLAGMTVRIGDRVYDGSVETQLKMARKAMIERAVDMIETHPEQFVQT